MRIRGARQHNLKNIDIDLPRRALVVVSGVSGSGKSSLIFDTIYAEGQRRYVESLSTYTKQFLERMEKPDVDELSGISPAIAIRQQNATKSARSTVGTATEVYDYLRLLFARAAERHCPECSRVSRPTSASQAALASLAGHSEAQKCLILFRMPLASANRLDEALDTLRAAGFVRLYQGNETVELDELPPIPKRQKSLEVVVDRIALRTASRARLAEAFETAYRAGGGRASLLFVDSGERLEFADDSRCPYCETSLPEATPGLFSFNNPLGACPDCNGFGNRLEFDEKLIVPDPERNLEEGALAPWATSKFQYYAHKLEDYCLRNKISMRRPWCELPRPTQKHLLEGDKNFKGVIPFLEALRAKSYKKYARFFTRHFMGETTCRSCSGKRLKSEALCFKIQGEDIAAMTAHPLGKLETSIRSLDLEGEAAQIATDVLEELRSRIGFLCEVGLDYLTLDRLTRTLSGGEAQRINLATALGANLVDTLYVLDEPTVGMHARDTKRLLKTLSRLRAAGNSVLVVEHDLDVIEAADYFVDLGPGAGSRGGEVVFAGDRTALTDGRQPDQGKAEASRTMSYLSGENEVPQQDAPRPPGNRWIEIHNARLHNLKNVHFRLPLGLLVGVTGVSGSGKSTLVTEVLCKAVGNVVPPDRGAFGWYDSIDGAHLVRDLVVVDSSPIGRTPRSNPVSYMRALADIRSLYAATREARLRRLSPGHFSFNTKGGRCESCEGMGYVQIEMHFMADLFVKCEHCDGQRFQPEVLEVQYRGRNIAEVLDMTVDEAINFFHDSPALGSKLYVLQRAGLGYLRLGQPAPTLSGGESQRLKIARALSSKQQGNMLYVFDEPTTGLHLDDVTRLLRTLHELVDRGHSVLLIEHHLDAIQACDWIIDLGPEAGDRGGEIIYEGAPAGLLGQRRSHTGHCLKNYRERGSELCGSS